MYLLRICIFIYFHSAIILEYLVIKCFLYLKNPEEVVIVERQSLLTLEIPQQSTDRPELEDDTEEAFVSGRKDIMKVPLIP
jgi:hypothetical protein